MKTYPRIPMTAALKRCRGVKEATSPGVESVSVLAGSRCTLEFPQQFGHLLACLAAADAILFLNPEARCFRKNPVPGREADTGTDLFSFLRSAENHLPV